MHDIESHGAPDQKTQVPPRFVTRELMNELRSHLPASSSITIHSEDAIKNSGFTLNRALIANLLAFSGTTLDLDATRFDPSKRVLAGTTIWRVGVESNPRPFETPSLATTGSLATVMSSDLTALQKGAFRRTFDSLRRPLWDSSFESAATSGGSSAGWTPEPPSRLRNTGAKPTPECEAAVPRLFAAAENLRSLGVELRKDGFDEAQEVVSIESVVRAISLPHKDCIVRTGSTNPSVKVDEKGRIWFPLPGHTDGDFGFDFTKSHIALIDPDKLQLWAKSANANKLTDPVWWDRTKRDVSVETLDSIAVVGARDLTVNEVLWQAHAAREDYSRALNLLALRANSPHGLAGRIAPKADRARRALADAAQIVALAHRASPYELDLLGWPELKSIHAWIFAATSGDTFEIPSPEGFLRSRASESFLRNHWAPLLRKLDAEMEDVQDRPEELISLAQSVPTRSGGVDLSKVQPRIANAIRNFLRDLSKKDLELTMRFAVRSSADQPLNESPEQ